MQFLSASDNILQKSQDSETLARNLWLLDLNSDMLILSQLISLSRNKELPFRTLFFDQKPVFCLS
jgi:hypothetical protein